MKTILIVDDDPVIRHSMTETLSLMGYHVITAFDGVDAMKQVQAHDLDVVFLDIFMPEKDGFETLADIQRFDREIKIIAMSAHNSESFEPLVYARSLGADDILVKPFSVDDIVTVLDRIS